MQIFFFSNYMLVFRQHKIKMLPKYSFDIQLANQLKVFYQKTYILYLTRRRQTDKQENNDQLQNNNKSKLIYHQIIANKYLIYSNLIIPMENNSLIKRVMQFFQTSNTIQIFIVIKYISFITLNLRCRLPSCFLQILKIISFLSISFISIFRNILMNIFAIYKLKIIPFSFKIEKLQQQQINLQVMFCCCCPSANNDQDVINDSSPEEKLLQDSTKPLPQKIPLTKDSSIEIQVTHQSKTIPINSYLKSMDDIENHYSNSFKDENDMPIESKVSSKSLNRISSSQDLEKSKKKSDLWDQQSGTKILYYFNHKSSEMVFTFKVSKFKVDQNNLVNYAINPKKHSHKIRAKPEQPFLCLVIFSKTLSDLKILSKTINAESHIKIILGVLNKQDDYKIPKSHYQNDEIHEIILIGNNCLKLQSFDKIVISTLMEKQFNNILQFCQKNTEFYELEELSKIVFLFPPEITLSEINLIFSKLFRKFLISQKLEKIIKYLGFHIQLISSDKCEPAIIVKSNLLQSEPEQIANREFENRLELAIGLLMIEIDYTNFKSYKKIMQNFYNDMSIIKYLKFIQYLHKEKKEFINKLEDLKIFEKEELIEIQKSNKIEEKVINSSEACVIIKHRNKKKMNELFGQYRNTQTPGERLERKEKEWDDDLKENDIRVTVNDKNEVQSNDNCNIFQVIDDGDIDDAQLDIISDLEPIDFNEGN